MKDVVENALKNHVFFGISILKGFWVDFERVLGGQNHRFSHFFRNFFDAKFTVQFGRQKIRRKKTILEAKRSILEAKMEGTQIVWVFFGEVSGMAEALSEARIRQYRWSAWWSFRRCVALPLLLCLSRSGFIGCCFRR